MPADTRPTVDVTTPNGVLRGIQRPGSAAFLGIPFAEAPVGERRFQAPVATGAWTGIREALHYGATPQREALAEITLIPEPSVAGESTLNLNVFTPAPGDDGAALPVLVWIHGGGFVAGSPASPWYDGEAFNRDGVVTVSVSYRLGFDGFGWIEDAPHNRGVLDWVMALEWVRDNITSFGGDPARVTIAGQSAGGGAVLTLMAVPRAAGLFGGAISISGAASDVLPTGAEATGRALAALGGVSATVAGFSSLPESRILELQNSVSAVGKSDASDPLAGVIGLVDTGLNLGPVVDGTVVTHTVADTFRGGIARDKALMLGATDNEFNMMLGGQEDALGSIEPSAALADFRLSAASAAAYVAAHSQSSTAELLGQFVTDSVFRSKALDYARIRDLAGSPAFLYRFSWNSVSMGSSCHCLDVPFFFDCLGRDGVEYLAGPNPPQSLAADIHSAAVRFISTGEPGFAAYTDSTRTVKVWDVPSSLATDAYADAAVLLDN